MSTKILNVDVAELQRHDPFCIHVRDVANDRLQFQGKRVEIPGPSAVVYDDHRTMGARVWVEVEGEVIVHTKDGIVVVK